MATARQQIDQLSRNQEQTRFLGISPQQTGTLGIPDATLQRMSPLNQPLLPVMKGSSEAIDTELNRCRQYKGISGLRQAIADMGQGNTQAVRCGWRYKPSTSGINPLISQGALGTEAGPLKGGVNEADSVVDGTRWYFDLEEAEKQISKDVQNRLRGCSDLSLLGSQADFFGFCKATRSIIPITVNRAGQTAPRFTDPGMTCDPSQIITAKNVSQCPQGFVGGQGAQSLRLSAVRGDEQKEGFIDQACKTSPLTRDCVIQAARLAGCDDRGSLITALKQGDITGKNGYFSALKDKPSYTAYQSLTNPNLSQGVLRDGSASLQMAIDTFEKLLDNTHAQKEKTRLSAVDLCLKAGAFDSYDFCGEMTETTQITPANLSCAQRIWKEEGGTEKGSGYGAIQTSWMGKSMGDFRTYVRSIVERVNSLDGWSQRSYYADLLGISIQGPNSTRIPTGTAQALGTELIMCTMPTDGWTPAIVLGQRILQGGLGKGEAMPDIINNQTRLRELTGRTRNVSMMMIQDIRVEKPMSIQFLFSTAGGFCMGWNRMPYEPIGDRKDSSCWGDASYKYVVSPCYEVKKDADAQPNILVAKLTTMNNSPFFRAHYKECSGGTQTGCGVRVRYIRIQPWYPTSSPIIQIAQLAVYDENGVNVALGKRTSARNIYPWGNPHSGWPVNGDLTAHDYPQIYHSLPNNDRGDWWEVDLGQEYSISKVVYYNRSGCCNDRANGQAVIMMNSQRVGTKSVILTSALVQTFAIGTSPTCGESTVMVPGIKTSFNPSEAQYANLTPISVGTRTDSWWIERCYLTQEPAAPWMQMEVADRPDYTGNSRITLCDRRVVHMYNETVIYNVTSIIDKQTLSELPGGKARVRFTSGSKWHTQQMFAYSGFRTMTILLRVTSPVTSGQSVHVFSHSNFIDNVLSLTLTNPGSGDHMLVLKAVTPQRVVEGRVRFQLNSWNLVVLQYVQDPGASSTVLDSMNPQPVTDIKLHCFPLFTLGSGTSVEAAWKEMNSALRSASRSSLFSVVPDIDNTRAGAGFLVLGQLDPSYTNNKVTMDGFTGEVAWIHGFRAAFDTKSMLEAEARQQWKQIWYRNNF